MKKLFGTLSPHRRGSLSQKKVLAAKTIAGRADIKFNRATSTLFDG